MEKRVRQLEATVADLAAAVARLEFEVRALRAEKLAATGTDGAAVVAPPPALAAPAQAPASEPAASSFGQVLTALGRTFLVLGGAFLIRAITDAGLVPRASGVALGFGFALLWCWAADRALARSQPLSAGFHAVSAALIAYPLVWETSTRLDVLSPPVSAAALTTATLALLAVARRHAVQGVAWLGVSASVCTALALVAATDAMGALLLALMTLLAAALALEDHRGWTGLRWPLALCADFVLLRLGNSLQPERAADVGPHAGIALALALPALQLGGLAVRSLVRRRGAGIFELVQVPLALLVGVGSALHISAAHGGAAWPFGALCLAAAAGGYAAGLAVVARREPPGHDLDLHLGLALALTLVGAELLGGGPLAGLAWAALGLVAVWLGRRAGWAAWVQGAIYLWAAAGPTGLWALIADGLVGAPEQPLAHLSAASLACVAAAAIAAGIVFTRSEAELFRRLLRAAFGLLLLLAIDGLAAALLVRALGNSDPAALATLRTGVLAASALSLAAARRMTQLPELGWLSLGTLAAGALKLLAEDLPHGRAITLVLAFSMYGLALIFVPRLARERAG